MYCWQLEVSGLDPEDSVVLGGEWNCCVDFTLDRTGEELSLQSSALSPVLMKTDLFYVWRMKHPLVRLYI